MNKSRFLQFSFKILGIPALCTNMASAELAGAIASPLEVWSNPDAACSAMASANFSDVADAPTQITDASFVKGPDRGPEYCRVTGYVAPQVGFKLALPKSWNT